MIAAKWLGVAAVAAGAVQIAPAGTWLPPVRARLTPQLDSPMPAGSVALTFDDGPHPLGTIAVLDMLDELEWPATFFVLGSQARLYPEVVQEVVHRGHAVAAHGFDHRYLIARGPRAVRNDLVLAIEVISDITGLPIRWWRPPFGVLSGPGLIAARRAGVKPLLWSAWGMDWLAEATAESVCHDVCFGRLDGGTILLHDSDGQSAGDSWRRTVDSLPLIAEQLAARRLQVAALPPITP